jgi:hypothetical protein
MNRKAVQHSRLGSYVVIEMSWGNIEMEGERDGAEEEGKHREARTCQEE